MDGRTFHDSLMSLYWPTLHATPINLCIVIRHINLEERVLHDIVRVNGLIILLGKTTKHKALMAPDLTRLLLLDEGKRSRYITISCS